MRALALLGLVLGVLAACESPTKAPPPAAELPPSPPPVIEAPPAPPPVAPPVAPPPPGPVTPAAQQQAQRTALSAAEMLESGSEEAARAGLQRALALDPQNKLALSLVRQMAPDALGSLPRESFAYTVRPSDTMSRIAQRFLGDVYSFYILARYNDIKVPKLVSAGQVLRIPGKAPVAAAAPPAPPSPPTALPAEAAPRPPAPPPVAATPAPPPVAATPAPLPVATTPAPPPEPTAGERAMRSAAAFERGGDLVRARAEYQNAASLGQPGAVAKADQLRAQLVARLSTEARTALARQDLDASIGSWQRVLEVDPDNGTARYELDRVRGLKEKLKNVQ
jgi:LysM repeat protein